MKRPVIAAGLIALSLVVGLARSAAAHPLDMGYLRFEASPGQISIALDVDVAVAASLLGIEERALDARAVSGRATELANASYRLQPLTTNSGECTWTTASGELRGRTVVIAERAMCPTGVSVVTWSLPFVPRISSTFQVLVKARGFDTERIEILDKASTTIELSGAVTALSFGTFVWSGVEHIGATPSEWYGPRGLQLADGIDHILFLIALMLGGGTLLRMIGIASGFTVGHSLTLALATLDVVRPPGWLIEPLIALSIAAVALEAFTGKFDKHRWKLATGFGLIHGFGFANALIELELSTGDMFRALFGYNLGVELGQVGIVIVIAPLVMLVHRHERVRPYVVRGLAGSIFVAGIYWFLLRVFG